MRFITIQTRNFPFLIKFFYQEVCQVSKEFFPKMAKGFESEKLTLLFGDGFEFLKNLKQEFDVIITDSSDHKGVLLFKLYNLINYFILNKKKIIIGPAGSLWNSHYYELMKDALKPNGIVCNQGEKRFFFFFKLKFKMTQNR